MTVEIIYQSVKGVFQYFCFPDKPKKGGNILHFSKGGNLTKRGGGGWGVDLEKGEYETLTNYALAFIAID